MALLWDTISYKGTEDGKGCLLLVLSRLTLTATITRFGVLHNI